MKGARSPYPPAWTFLIPLGIVVAAVILLTGCADFYLLYIYPMTHGALKP